MAFDTASSWFVLLVGVLSVTMAVLRLRNPGRRTRRGDREWGPAAQFALGLALVLGPTRQLTNPPHALGLVLDLSGLAAAFTAVVLSLRTPARR